MLLLLAEAAGADSGDERARRLKVADSGDERARRLKAAPRRAPPKTHRAPAKKKKPAGPPPTPKWLTGPRPAARTAEPLVLQGGGNLSAVVDPLTWQLKYADLSVEHGAGD